MTEDLITLRSDAGLPYIDVNAPRVRTITIYHNAYYRSVKPNYQKYKAFLCSFQGRFARVVYFNHLSNNVCSNEQGGLL
jgi:hypothetical protein